MNILTIACDIDGVLANLLLPWLARYNKDYNDNLNPDDISDWYTDKFVKPECGKKIYDYLKDPSLYDECLPYEGSLYMISKLKNIAGCRIVYGTSSPAESYGKKFFWLKEYGFIFDQKDYFETSDKSLIRADVLIDDYWENLLNFTGYGILLERPWNKNRYGDYYRAKDFSAVLEICEIIANIKKIDIETKTIREKREKLYAI